MTTNAGLRQSESDVFQVLEVARQLAVEVDLPVVLGKVIDAGRAVLQADRGTVFLYDEPTRELVLITGTGLASLRFSVDQGIAGQCARTWEILNIPDCYADARFNQDVDRKTGYRSRCLLTVPLIGLDNRLVGVLQLLNAAKGRFDDRDERLAVALASQAAVAIQRAILLEERQVKLKLERDLALAREIQQAVLPQLLPDVEGYDLAAFNRPADETGGDIYDIISLAKNPDEPDPRAPLVLLIGDATGHGVGPAISITQVRSMLRLALRLGAAIEDSVSHIDAQLNADLDAARFVTAFIGQLDPNRHTMRYLAPGQGPLLHYHVARDEFEVRDASGIPLGIMPGLGHDTPEPFCFDPGDVLVLLTDGFYEAHDPADEEMGLERVQELISAHHRGTARELVEALVAGVDQFRATKPQLDDLTAVIVKRRNE